MKLYELTLSSVEIFPKKDQILSKHIFSEKEIIEFFNKINHILLKPHSSESLIKTFKNFPKGVEFRLFFNNGSPQQDCSFKLIEPDKLPKSFNVFCRNNEYSLNVLFPKDYIALTFILNDLLDSNKYENIKNIRICLISDNEALNLYEKAKTMSYLKSFDKDYLIDSVVYRIGFNYGRESL